ncbi:metal-dependent transcriptional regulator [Maribacter chungangensis]|uniref:Transcriptional regulator MntR n=1 Tax=Maribacter chungangensis TaxID=1069117 RepID=A0ABW3AYK3_9FLAO
MTPAEEDYIKAIYHLGKDGKATVTTNAIAARMETKPSSVTDMIKKLSDKNLIAYKKYKGVSLTESGTLSALSVIRKQYLWEVFLGEKLEVPEEEIANLAEQLKHIKSERLIAKLDAYLGNPRVGFFGASIPHKDGKFKKTVKKLLNGLTPGTKGICVGINDASAAFLKFLEKKGIALGNNILVLEREEFDGSMKIKIDQKEIQISDQIASNLFLEVTEDE